MSVPKPKFNEGDLVYPQPLPGGAFIPSLTWFLNHPPIVVTSRLYTGLPNINAGEKSWHYNLENALGERYESLSENRIYPETRPTVIAKWKVMNAD